MPIVVFVSLVVLAGALATVLAAHRSVAQPLSLADDEEKQILGHVLANPSVIALCGVLTAEHFADEARGRMWGELVAAVGFALPTEDESVARALMSQVPHDLTAKVSDRDLADTLMSATTGVDEKTALEAGVKVLDAGDDRLMFGSQGAGTVKRGPAGGPTLVRDYRRPGVVRALVGALLAAVGAVGAARLDLDTWSLAALGVLVVGSVVWAFVDFDTLYIDYPTMAVFGIGAWLLGIAGALSDDAGSRIVTGALSALFVAVSFEGANFVFKKIRGVDGMGGGDAVLVLATVGVPALVTGSVWVAYTSVLVSLVAAIGGWVLLRLARGATSRTPFALGPYLALGWMAALHLAEMSPW